MRGVACLDIGSTYTKGALVDLDDGRLVATTSTPTTAGTDVLDGVDAVLAALGPHDEVRACSSAGGGLRLAVVGYERVVTAEAGRRTALSAGARVVQVSAGRLSRTDVAALLAATPDVVLLCGGTDGGDGEVLAHNARVLGRSRVRGPYVIAGNVDAQDEVAALLRRRTVVRVANVLPEIGRFSPGPARAAVRDLFVTHVIGGKGLTRRPARLRGMVRAATPDAVLAGVEGLALLHGDVLMVDVGGATTDVCSALDLARGDDPSSRGGPADVAGEAAVLRTVEGDLGVRWSAPSVLEAAAAERLSPQVDGLDAAGLDAAALARQADPSFLPASPQEVAVDRELARLAVTVALRRHARGTGGVGGRDLRRVALVVGSGGVLRHADAAGRTAMLAAATTDHSGGWKVPERAAVTVDVAYVLAAAGLLAPDHSAAAQALLATAIPTAL